MKNINIDKLFDKARLERPGIAREDIKNILHNGAVSNSYNVMKFANKTGKLKMATIGSIAAVGAISIALLTNPQSTEQIKSSSPEANYTKTYEVSSKEFKEIPQNTKEIKLNFSPKISINEDAPNVKSLDLSADELKNIGVDVIDNGEAIFYSKEDNGSYSKTRLTPDGISVESVESIPESDIVILAPSIITDESGRSKFKVKIGKMGDNINSSSKAMFFCASMSDEFFAKDKNANHACSTMKIRISDNSNVGLSFSSSEDTSKVADGNTNADDYIEIPEINSRIKIEFDKNQFHSIPLDRTLNLDMDMQNLNSDMRNLLNENLSINYNNLILDDSIQSKFANQSNLPIITFQNEKQIGANDFTTNFNTYENDTNVKIKVYRFGDLKIPSLDKFNSLDLSDSQAPCCESKRKIIKKIIIRNCKDSLNDDSLARFNCDSIIKSELPDYDMESFLDKNKINDDFSFVNLTPIKVVTGLNSSKQRTYFIWINPNEKVVNSLPKEKAEIINNELNALAELKQNKNINYESFVQKGMAMKGGYLDVWNANEGAIAGFTVFPNPTVNKSATLKFKLYKDRNITATIYDLKGAKMKDLVLNSAFKESEINQDIDLSGLSSGIYIIELVSDKGEKVSQRIIVE